MTRSSSEPHPGVAVAPRYLPELPLPPYAYLPGRFPHPTRDRGGHGNPVPAGPVVCPAPLAWRDDVVYLRGVDLFNHGYYWEAHEAWEALWHACGRRGEVAELLRGLILLAGAGFMARRERDRGRARLAAAAAARFASVGGGTREGARRLLGLRPAVLTERAEAASRGDGLRVADPGAAAAPVFTWELAPE